MNEGCQTLFNDFEVLRIEPIKQQAEILVSKSSAEKATQNVKDSESIIPHLIALELSFVCATFDFFK